MPRTPLPKSNFHAIFEGRILEEGEEEVNTQQDRSLSPTLSANSSISSTSSSLLSISQFGIDDAATTTATATATAITNDTAN